MEHRSRCLVYTFVLAVLLTFAYTGNAQVSPESGNKSVRTLQLKSKLMARDMPYRVVLPVNYDDERDKRRFGVVYLLHGLTGHYDNWTDKTGLAEYSKQYDLIIVTPEGGDGWYSDSLAVPNDKYESYVIRELIPEIDKNYRTMADREHRFVAGLSMGGYGALKFGLKYPEMFSLVGSFSGALGAASFTEKGIGAIGKTIDAIFGPPESDARKGNDIFGMVKDLSPDQLKKLPFIYVDCGTEDFLFKNNRDFIDLLITKKVPHEFRELPGAHNWTFWDSQVKEFLRIAGRRITTQKSVAAAH
ncbi:MAG: alpha/beta hydrolase family protein [Acidobacteriota bacterium]